jgi:hypothetical protein
MTEVECRLLSGESWVVVLPQEPVETNLVADLRCVLLHEFADGRLFADGLHLDDDGAPLPSPHEGEGRLVVHVTPKMPDLGPIPIIETPTPPDSPRLLIENASPSMSSKKMSGRSWAGLFALCLTLVAVSLSNVDVLAQSFEKMLPGPAKKHTKAANAPIAATAAANVTASGPDMLWSSRTFEWGSQRASIPPPSSPPPPRFTRPEMRPRSTPHFATGTAGATGAKGAAHGDTKIGERRSWRETARSVFVAPVFTKAATLWRPAAKQALALAVFLARRLLPRHTCERVLKFARAKGLSASELSCTL